jgi:tRNA G10  N-methylase Trm11
MQNKYCFILGRYPDLSKHEISAVLRKKGLETSIHYESSTVLILDVSEELPVAELNKTLGGTVKIGKIIQNFPQSVNPEKIHDYLTSDVLFIDYLQEATPKITFGISLYSYPRSHAMHNPWMRVQRELIKTLKKHLESQGFKARYPYLEGNFLSSASVEKNNLLRDGVEILMIETPTELLFGKTLVVQEFESFSNRDFGRPKRDMDSGIMPPKVARMMINIAEIPLSGELLDPFCGSGTLLQEALLLGYTHVTGTDISAKAVTDTKANLSWLKKQDLSDNNAKVFIYDVTKLSEKFPQDSIAAVVTEPYMGPNLQHKPHLKDVQEIKAELEMLFLGAFKQFVKILKEGGSVVMIFPIFHVNNHYLYLDILEKIEQLGFSQAILTKDKRNTITLGNKKDFVLREIVKFKVIMGGK